MEQLVWGQREVGLHVGVYGREGEFSICTGLTGMNGKNRVLVVKCIMGTIVLVFFAPAELRA